MHFAVGKIIVLLPSSRQQATVHRTVAYNRSNPSPKLTYKNNTHQKMGVNFMAEKEGFEPSIPFWGIHDFQSCALGQLRDFSKFCNQLAYNTTFDRVCQDLIFIIFVRFMYSLS